MSKFKSLRKTFISNTNPPDLGKVPKSGFEFVDHWMLPRSTNIFFSCFSVQILTDTVWCSMYLLGTFHWHNLNDSDCSEFSKYIVIWTCMNTCSREKITKLWVCLRISVILHTPTFGLSSLVPRWKGQRDIFFGGGGRVCITIQLL